MLSGTLQSSTPGRPAPNPTRWARSKSPQTATTARRPPARSSTSTLAKTLCRPSSSWSFGILKKAAALVNQDLGKLSARKLRSITSRAADEVISGKLNG